MKEDDGKIDLFLWYRWWSCAGARDRSQNVGATRSIGRFGWLCHSWSIERPSVAIVVPLCFAIISLVFFYLCQVLFSGFLQFNSNFVDAQNSSKYRDWAPSRCVKGAAYERVVLSGQTIKKCIEGQVFWRRVGASLSEITIRLLLTSPRRVKSDWSDVKNSRKVSMA